MEQTNETPAKVCDACLTGSIIQGTPTGNIPNETLGGVKYYVTAAPSTDPTKVIILACDIFGLGISNPKLIADQLAKDTGYVVYVPDLLEGDYPNADKLSSVLVEKPMATESFLTRTMATFKMISGFMVHVGPGFLFRHRPSVTVALARQFCLALRSEKGVQRIGAIGFCLGGVQVTLLASSKVLPKAIDAVVIAHPGSLSVNDFKNVEIPLSMILAQEDFTFDSIKAGVLKVLDEKKANGGVAEYTNYPGTTHGFACRPKEGDEEIQKAFEASVAQTSAFFKSNL